jgi:hypothetical protein
LSADCPRNSLAAPRSGAPPGAHKRKAGPAGTGTGSIESKTKGDASEYRASAADPQPAIDRAPRITQPFGLLWAANDDPEGVNRAIFRAIDAVITNGKCLFRRELAVFNSIANHFFCDRELTKQEVAFLAELLSICLNRMAFNAFPRSEDDARQAGGRSHA